MKKEENLFDVLLEINAREKKTFDREVLTNIFIKYMKGIDENELVSMLYSKYEALVDFVRLCDNIKTGYKISMLFNPHRYSTPVVKNKSIIDAFKDEKFLRGLARVTNWREKNTTANVKDLLYLNLHIGINGVQAVYDFQPWVARQIYQYYRAKRILDPCAGWGGRMIGAASIGAYYHGFEPSTKTYEGLLKLGEFLKEFQTGFDYKIECLPFEDAKLKGTYDVAMTSPPYYDTELYSDEETNSCNRYKSFESWCDGFYIPMMEKAVKHTNYFILNVGDRKYALKKVMYDNFNATVIDILLNGGAGFGKKKEQEEAFYLVTKK